MSFCKSVRKLWNKFQSILKHFAVFNENYQIILQRCLNHQAFRILFLLFLTTQSIKLYSWLYFTNTYLKVVKDVVNGNTRCLRNVFNDILFKIRPTTKNSEARHQRRSKNWMFMCQSYSKWFKLRILSKYLETVASDSLAFLYTAL